MNTAIEREMLKCIFAPARPWVKLLAIERIKQQPFFGVDKFPSGGVITWRRIIR